MATSLALGVYLRISFTKGDDKRPFNLVDISKRSPEDIPGDIAEEIFHGIQPSSQPYPGEWVFIYGGSIYRNPRIASFFIADLSSLTRNFGLGIDITCAHYY